MIATLVACAVTQEAGRAGEKPVPAAGPAAAKGALTEAAPVRVAGPAGDTVTLVERSNPKIVGLVPPGWTIVPLTGAKMESEPVEVRPGVRGVIEVNPYQLVPDPARVAVRDPGFAPALGNAQTATVGAVLTRCNDEAADLSTKLDAALKTLQTALTPKKPPVAGKGMAKAEKPPSGQTP